MKKLAHSTDQTAEQAAMYCLGNLSEAEREVYEEHLSACATCRAEVEAYSSTIAALALANPVDLRPTARSDFLERLRNDKTYAVGLAKLSSVISSFVLLERNLTIVKLRTS